MNFAWGLKNRLLLTLLMFSLVPIVIVAVFTSRYYAGLAERQMAEVSANTLERSAIRLTSLLDEIRRVSEYLVFQQTSGPDTVISFLPRYRPGSPVSAYDRLRNARDFRAATEGFLLNHDYIEGLYLFAEDGTIFSNTKGSELKLGYRPFDAPWYLETLRKEGKLYASQVGKRDFLLSGDRSIAFSRALYDPRTRERIGVLVINCSLGLFKEMNEGLLDGERIGLTDGEGVPLYGGEPGADPDLALPAGETGSRIDPAGNRFYVYNTFSDYGWHMIVSVSLNAVTRQVRSTLTFAACFAAIWAVLSILLSFWIANAFSKPVSLMAQLMRRYEAGRLPPKLDAYARRTDEIGVLYTRYHAMLREIETLIREQYHNRLIAMSSKMKALEAQINSHFLFNTLTTMNSIAELEEVPSIAVISKALGDMFRYSIKIKRDRVPLHAELEHVNNYMTIQSYRYGERIRLTTDIPDEWRTMPVLKLILQPIVENAVYHGIEPKRGRGCVHIRAYASEGTFRLDIADDGVGIPQGKLALLRHMLQEAPGFDGLHPGTEDVRSIGLYNVHARISLYYGAPYGIQVESPAGGGTCVRIALPLQASSETGPPERIRDAKEAAPPLEER